MSPAHANFNRLDFIIIFPINTYYNLVLYMIKFKKTHKPFKQPFRFNLSAFLKGLNHLLNLTNLLKADHITQAWVQRFNWLTHDFVFMNQFP